MNLYYIYHSGFVVEGEENILIFDYYKIPKEKQKESKAFMERFIEQEKKQVFVFSSHSHSDHFNPEILSWTKYNEAIQYIFSDDILKKNTEGKKVCWVKEGDSIELEELGISVYGSTDLGVSFVVEMEGKTIFHAGDLHLWHWEGDSPEEEKAMKDHYLRVLQEIAEDSHGVIDYAFSPLDSRLGVHTLESFEYLFQYLDILYFIPMHIQDDYSVFHTFEKEVEEKEYEIETIFYQDSMQDLSSSFYMLQEVARSYSVVLVNSKGRVLDKKYLERDSIYEYLSSQGQDAFFSGWGESEIENRLEGKKELIEFLEKSSCFVDENFENIVFEKAKVALHFEEEEEREGWYRSSLELEEGEKKLTFLAEGYFIALAEKNEKTGKTIFYKALGESKTFYTLEDFFSEVTEESLESFLSLAHSAFPDLEFRYRDFKVLVGEKIEPKPRIVIEKISADNSLYMRVGADVSTMNYKFLKDHGLEEVVIVNTREKKLQISSIDLSAVNLLLEEFIKIFVKIQREFSLRQGYYLDENLFFILPENVAREFITKHLLYFANHYAISGTETLKKYNIRTVKPKIVGNFHYSIDFLEGEAEIDIEGEKFSIQEVLASYHKDAYIVLSDGTNALINKRYIEKLERIFKEGEDNQVKISFFDLPLVDEMIENKILSQEYLLHRNFFYGMNHLEHYEVELPKLEATLRTYQEYGFKWLSYLMEKNLGACLADDMGLGKTLQAISVLTKLHEQKGKHSLIIMPKSLIFNWESEMKRFSPKLKVGIYYGNNREQKVFEKKEVILTTYGTVRNDIKLLQEIPFDLVILDESQNIKNIQSQTTKAVMLLQAKNRIALSGTPIENNLMELYSLFRFLNPGMFGSVEEFNNSYVLPIQKENNVDLIQELRKKIYPFLLRRVKKEVLKDLPEKIEKVIYMEMNAEHKKYYEERRMHYYTLIHNNIKEKGLGKAQFFILQALNELRQITSCPETKNAYIHSSKKEMLLEQIVEAVENNHKVLVFTNYIGSIESISKALEKEGIPYLSMTGNTKDRQALVQKFQKEDRYKVFVMTLKTGGVGLNLTAADTIFIYDPWWNKTVENQAIDRAYRLGQDRTVFSYKLILKDTIEEKILQLQDLKSKLLEDVISEDNLSSKSFTEKDIEFILGK